MLSRRPSARKFQNKASSGRPQLTFAKFILLTEATLRYFARPLFFAALFLALSWMGIFTALYPWAHLVALALFIVLFFDAFGRSHILWKRPSLSLAMRRVEEATGLLHRPLDVLIDRPVGVSEETYTLWQEHVLRARAQTKKLRLPQWKFDFAKHDPYRLRYIVGVLLTVGLVMGWGALGGRLIAAINPALGRIPINTTTVDAWITPPEYTHLPPIMIATPAGTRFQDEVIKVPEGSVLHAHLAEHDGKTPVLEANGQEVDFGAEDGKDFGVTTALSSGNTVAIHRGWATLGSWKVQVVPDQAPQVSFTDLPAATEHKDVRVSYDAKDDYGVTSVTLRMTPRETLPGISADPVEFPLAKLDEKDVKRTDFKDLTAEVWAGKSVELQLIATDAVGHKSESDRVAYTLPERAFFQPIARILIDERKKLLTNVFDQQVRGETASLMAGVAKQPSTFDGDQVVMMALRAGAVRLVLDHELDAALSAKDILWQAAVRIEDGAMGLAEQNLKQAQEDLANALDRNASEKEIQALIDRLHQALGQYLAQLSTRMAAQPMSPDDLKQMTGARTNTLTPQDLEKMLNDMRGLSANGSRDEARQELAKMKEMLENLATGPRKLTAAQKEALELGKEVQQAARDQQELMDKTFQDSQKEGKTDPKESQALSDKQGKILDKLHGVMQKVKGNSALSQSASAMEKAQGSLKQGSLSGALPDQNEALKSLRDAQESMGKSMQAGQSGTPMDGAAGVAGGDPFGRDNGKSLLGDTTKTRVPDHFETQKVREILDEIQRRAGDLTRPKIERDYFERLLQNF